jgi:hypothetical protein
LVITVKRGTKIYKCKINAKLGIDQSISISKNPIPNMKEGRKERRKQNVNARKQQNEMSIPLLKDVETIFNLHSNIIQKWMVLNRYNEARVHYTTIASQ